MSNQDDITEATEALHEAIQDDADPAEIRGLAQRAADLTRRSAEASDDDVNAAMEFMVAGSLYIDAEMKPEALAAFERAKALRANTEFQKRLSERIADAHRLP